MNNVGVVHDKMEVACLDKGNSNYNTAWTKLVYRLPMTNIEEYKQSTENPELINVTFYSRNESSNQNKPLFGRWNLQDECKTIKAKKDSLFASNPDASTKPSYFIRHEVKYRGNMLIPPSSLSKNLQNTTDNIHNDEYSLYWSKYTLDNGIYRNEHILSRGTRVFFFSARVSGFLGCRRDMLLGNPGWFSLEDISQQYFDLKLDFCNIDSLSLTIDFVGATEFSNMTPSPDMTTMSSIVFTDKSKIEQISKHGLRFHAKFKELENRQNVRLFFLTAVMSALFTIFLVFIVLGIYKLNMTLTERKEGIEKTNE